MIAQFTKIQSPDDVLNRVQDQLAKTLNPVLRNSLLNGNLVRGVVLVASTPQQVAHGLGRPWVSFFVCNPRAAAEIYGTSLPTDGNANLVLSVESSADVTTDLWVF